MALAITKEAMAVELRIIADEAQAIPAAYNGMLTRRMQQAEFRIEAYAENAPEAAKVEAAVRWLGYSMDTPTASSGSAFADAFRHSGAMAELAQWRSHIVYDFDDPEPEREITPTPGHQAAIIVPEAVLIYIWGQSDQSAPTGIPQGAESTSGLTVSLPDQSADFYIVIAQPASAADFTVIAEGGFAQTGAYTKGADTFHDGIDYEYWISNRQAPGGSGSGGHFHFTR